MSTTTANGKAADALEIATQYFLRGWCAIPIPFRSKIPVISEWEKLRLTRDELASRFAGRCNIGVHVGEPSGWLVDVDLDHLLAVELAPRYLPPTGAIFGRPSKLRSHWLYKLIRKAETKKFKFPKVEPKRETDGKMIVEFRSTGCQTVFPGSIHESGEPIAWSCSGDPAVIDPYELLASIDKLAQDVRRRLGYKPGDTLRKIFPREKPPVHARHDRPAPLNTVERARRYLANIPRAVSGSGGHDQTIVAATHLIRGFCLSRAQALALLGEWNQLCVPPWTERELEHKVDQAIEHGGARGFHLEGRRVRA